MEKTFVIFPNDILSVDLLHGFGFSEDGYKRQFIGKEYESGSMVYDFVLTKPFTMGEWQDFYAFELPSNRFVSIKYVYELQNLYLGIAKQSLI